jgi:hypothetical protein
VRLSLLRILKSLRSFTTIVLLLGTVPALTSAQCRDTDFVGKDGIAAAPSRPVESSSPDPIQVGVTETEMGFTRSWVTSNSSQNALGNLIKLGAWCNVEIRWGVNSLVSNTVASSTNTGFGDNVLAGQYRFHRETAKLPSMAVGYMVKFPSANPVMGLGSGQTDHMVMFLLGKTVKKYSIVMNVNYFAIGQPGGYYNNKSEWTLEVSRPLKGHWGVLGEVYYDSHLNAMNAAYGNSTWGVTYAVNPRLIFDAGAYVGFSNGPGVPGNSAFFGVSYAIGSLYARPKRTPPVVRE